jgi:hypothetical protein
VDELTYVNNSETLTYSGTTVMLTIEGRLALAVDALAAAQKTRKEEQRKSLWRQAMMYLRPFVQVS